MKKGSLLAAMLLAVTMLTVAGAQDPAPPPSDSQAQGAPQNVPPPDNVPPDAAGPQNGPPRAVNVSQEQEQGGPSAPDGNDANADPKAAVARVSLIHGDVSMQRGDSSEWSAVTMNTPLVQGDQIATNEKSRTEIQLDFANVVRLAASTQVKIADLGRTRIQLQVAQGYTSYSIFKGNEAEIEIDTPNVTVRPLRVGRYRVQVSSDSETDVIVREGEAEITTPQGSTTVQQGQLITIRGGDNPEYKTEAAPPGDDWDKWNLDRDRTIQNASSWQNTNRYYTGSNDLDTYGRWANVPGYGQVWQPSNQGSDWAPYQDGRWVWEPYWGWTWVSYEPWGWAPYHYGRWFYWNTGWVWWPGPVYPYYRPLWAPAYVSFFGFGGGFGFGFGFGSVGWLPCGPFDPFFPWFGRGFNRITVVNVFNFNVRNFNGHMVRPLGIAGRHPFISNTSLAMTNARVRAGITSVSRADFARGGAGSRRVGIDQAQLRNAHLMTSNVPVVPTRESLHSGAVRSGAVGIQSRSSGRFVTRSTPPAGPPAFHEQAAQMQRMVQNSGRNTTETASARMSGNEAAGRGQNSSPANSRPNTTETARTGGSTGANNSGNQGSRGGWQRFGGGNSTQAQNNARGPSGQRQGSPQGNSAGSSNNNRGGWSTFPRNSGGNNNTTKPQLQMAKPLVTPRTPPSYSRPSAPPSGQTYGGYNGGSNSSHGSSAGSYPRSYGGNRSSGSYGGNSGSYSGSRSSGSYGGSSGSSGGSRGSGNYGGNSSSYGGSRGSGSYGGNSSSYGGSRGSGSYGGSRGGSSGGSHSSGSYGGSRGSGSHSSSGGGHSGGGSHNDGHR